MNAEVRHYTIADLDDPATAENFEHQRTPTLCGKAPGLLPNTTTWQYVTCRDCLRALSSPAVIGPVQP
jgi:hypothetical protein